VQQTFGLPPGPTKGQTQQVSGLDRHVRVVAWPAPLTSPPGRVPGRERLRRGPDREAAALLECPVLLWPVAVLVACPGDLVAARLIGLVGHRASGKRGSGPIRSTLAQPKPKARNFAPTPLRSPQSVPASPEPKAVSFDFQSGLKTTVFTDGTTVEELFDRAAMKGVAGAHPTPKNMANVRLPPKSSEVQ